MQASEQLERRAIVVGGSMVGLAVARALSERFAEVLVIERDALSRDAPAHRRSTPQSYHIHNLTIRGQRELEELFPGFVEEAVRLGALRIDHGGDVARHTVHGFQPRFQSGFVALSATRALLEFAQRRRFFALAKNVRLLEQTRVTSLITARTDAGLSAVGVRTDDGASHSTLHADLVVDCSGRAAHWKKWFRQLGLALPRETVVDSDCAYSSRFVRSRDLARHSWLALTIDASFPQHPHWGVIVPLEDDQWVVTLGGFNGQHPPADELGFASFARQLASGSLADALTDAVPLSAIRTYRGMEMRWNHLADYDMPLRNFLVLGDAAFAYNPLYGQGISIGITMARMLRDELRARPMLADLGKRLYPACERFAFPYWQATAWNDMRWAKTIGRRPTLMRVAQPMAEFMLEATQYEEAVMRAVLATVHLLAPPSGLLRNASVWLSMLRHGLRKLAGRVAPRAPLSRFMRKV